MSKQLTRINEVAKQHNLSIDTEIISTGPRKQMRQVRLTSDEAINELRALTKQLGVQARVTARYEYREVETSGRTKGYFVKFLKEDGTVAHVRYFRYLQPTQLYTNSCNDRDLQELHRELAAALAIR